MAKLIHNWLIKNVHYKYHKDCLYCNPVKIFNNRGHIACADTSILTREMFSRCNITCRIVHGTGTQGHYWTQCKINGKWYNSDATSSRNKWNKVWQNLKPDRYCGKKPC